MNKKPISVVVITIFIAIAIFFLFKNVLDEENKKTIIKKQQIDSIQIIKQLCIERGHVFENESIGYATNINEFNPNPTKQKLVDTKDSSYIVTYIGYPTYYSCKRCKKEVVIEKDSTIKVIWRKQQSIPKIIKNY